MNQGTEGISSGPKATGEVPATARTCPKKDIPALNRTTCCFYFLSTGDNPSPSTDQQPPTLKLLLVSL